MAPFEALYGRRCTSSLVLFEVGYFSLFGLDIVYKSMEKVLMIRDRSKTSYFSWQKSHADNR